MKFKDRVEIYTDPSPFERIKLAGAAILGRAPVYDGEVSENGYNLRQAVQNPGRTLKLRVKGRGYDGKIPQKVEDSLRKALAISGEFLGVDPNEIYIVGNGRGLDETVLREDTSLNLDLRELMKRVNSGSEGSRRVA